MASASAPVPPVPGFQLHPAAAPNLSGAQSVHPGLLQSQQVLFTMRPSQPVNQCHPQVSYGLLYIALVVLTKVSCQTTGCPPPMANI